MERDDDVLPQRILATIHAEEIQSERLIGWTQLLVVGFFGVLYFLSPRPPDVAFGGAVPTALGLYTIFTLGRIAVSYRTLVPTWLLYVSALVDIAMLLGLIWYFHLQYAQPPAFYLKIPTFTYIFVFIALRALRFDARFVISTGLFGAIGWLVLVLYAIETSEPGTVTRRFVDYINGSRILVGAEIDKIVAILVVTAILGFAIHRGNRLLIKAVKAETSSRDMRRFLSSGVAEAITASEEGISAGDAEERNAAVLILDLRGFTRLSSALPPKEVVALLVGFHRRIVPIISSHEGVIDKYLGDGVMATFGAVRPSATAAADAMRAFDAILAESRGWRASLDLPGDMLGPTVNGALAAGNVVFTALGDEERLEYTVIGEPVNLATKLEKHNKVEGTAALTTRAAYDAAVAQGYSRRTPPPILPARRVAGVDEPIDLVVLAD